MMPPSKQALFTRELLLVLSGLLVFCFVPRTPARANPEFKQTNADLKQFIKIRNHLKKGNNQQARKLAQQIENRKETPLLLKSEAALHRAAAAEQEGKDRKALTILQSMQKSGQLSAYSEAEQKVLKTKITRLSKGEKPDSSQPLVQTLHLKESGAIVATASVNGDHSVADLKPTRIILADEKQKHTVPAFAGTRGAIIAPRVPPESYHLHVHGSCTPGIAKSKNLVTVTGKPSIVREKNWNIAHPVVLTPCGSDQSIPQKPAFKISMPKKEKEHGTQLPWPVQIRLLDLAGEAPISVWSWKHRPEDNSSPPGVNKKGILKITWDQRDRTFIPDGLKKGHRYKMIMSFQPFSEAEEGGKEEETVVTEFSY